MSREELKRNKGISATRRVHLPGLAAPNGHLTNNSYDTATMGSPYRGRNPSTPQVGSHINIPAAPMDRAVPRRRRQFVGAAADFCCSARRRRRYFVGAPPIPLLLRSYFLEFSMTSSLSSLPSGRSRPPMVSCFSMLSFSFKFAIFLAHHPVQLFFSWSSPSSFTIHSSFYYFSLKRFPCHYMSHPVPLSGSYCRGRVVKYYYILSCTGSMFESGYF